MLKSEMLNNITHKDLRVITQRSALYGDNVAGALVFPKEFAEVQKEYPIFFQKDAQTGDLQAIALFGFKKDENLFLNEQGWQASYIPAIMEREPFLIGFQQQDEEAEGRAPVICVDMAHPRVSTDAGEPVFLEHGGNSPYLEKTSNTLMLIHEGVAASQQMFAEFQALDLIEPFTLNIEFNDGVQYQSAAYYTINQEKFFALAAEPLQRMHQNGSLNLAYLVIASLSNIKKMIDMYHRRA